MHSTKSDAIKHHMQLLRQQFAQFESDPVAEALGASEMAQILTDEIGCYRERVYPPMVTLRLFIDQVLCADHACQDAVGQRPVSYTHLRAHETDSYLVCRLLLEKKKKQKQIQQKIK